MPILSVGRAEVSALGKLGCLEISMHLLSERISFVVEGI
jgi:hypothetical protein